MGLAVKGASIVPFADPPWYLIPNFVPSKGPCAYLAQVFRDTIPLLHRLASAAGRVSKDVRDIGACSMGTGMGRC